VLSLLEILPLDWNFWPFLEIFRDFQKSLRMFEMNYFSCFCKSFLVLFLRIIIGTPILRCTITDLSYFWYCSRDFLSWICESHALQAKDRTWANCALALSVSGASRSRLCSDEPRVHLSGPAYMPRCILTEIRLPLDQRVLCSDCCKNVGYYD